MLITTVCRDTVLGKLTVRMSRERPLQTITVLAFLVCSLVIQTGRATAEPEPISRCVPDQTGDDNGPPCLTPLSLDQEDDEGIDGAAHAGT